MKDNIFDVLNWILKKNHKTPNFQDTSIYMVNRWLSMSSKENCNIVNLTTNRWLKNNQYIPYIKFYRSMLAKQNSKINYIKRPKNETLDSQPDSVQSDDLKLSENEIKMLAENKEISIKEMIFLEKQLEEFESIVK